MVKYMNVQAHAMVHFIEELLEVGEEMGSSPGVGGMLLVNLMLKMPEMRPEFWNERQETMRFDLPNDEERFDEFIRNYREMVMKTVAEEAEVRSMSPAERQRERAHQIARKMMQMLGVEGEDAERVIEEADKEMSWSGGPAYSGDDPDGPEDEPAGPGDSDPILS